MKTIKIYFYSVVGEMVKEGVKDLEEIKARMSRVDYPSPLGYSKVAAMVHRLGLRMTSSEIRRLQAEINQVLGKGEVIQARKQILLALGHQNPTGTIEEWKAVLDNSRRG